MNENQRIIVGKRLRKIRESLNKTQDSFANSIGTDRTGLSKIENGKAELTYVHLFNVRNLHNADLNALFKNEDVPFFHDEILIELSIASEPIPQYGGVIIQKETIYMERLCAATAGVCFFEQLQKANEEIAKLKQEVETLRHTEGLKE